MKKYFAKLNANLNIDGLKRVLRLPGPQMKSYIIGLIVSGIAESSLIVIAGIALKYMVDTIIAHNVIGLIRILIIWVLISIFLCFIYYISKRLLNKSSRITIGRIKQDLYHRINDMPMKYFEDNKSGNILSTVSNDVQAMEAIYNDQLLGVFSNIVRGILSGAAILVLNWQIGLLAMFFGLLFVYVDTKFNHPLNMAGKKIQESLATYTQKLTDYLAGINVVKMFDIKKYIIHIHNMSSEDITSSLMHRAKINSLLGGINEVFRFLSMIGLLIIGSLYVFKSNNQFGSILAIVQLQEGFTFMFLYLGNLMAQLQGGLAAAERVFKVFDEKPEPKEYSTDLKGTSDFMIEIKSLDFSYEPNKKVLDSLDLSVKEGDIAALVGYSGSGKSTIFKLILGFYQLNNGQIYIDKKPISHYTIAQIRDRIAYVPQDTFLFTGTIEDNIRYGRTNATKDEIINAARQANAHDFITRLPDGYETLVGEEGNILSGGQKQRIAIARAILKNAPILLLDEATSALDSESESKIQQSLKELMKNRTTLVIAHRLSTIQNADIIYVIDNGKVIEKGSHLELLKEKSVYKRFYELQNTSTGIVV